MNKRPNIVMVMLDGARGERERESDDFTRLKKKGLFFNNIFTSSPYTLASIHSLFTGIYGSNNGVKGYYKINNLDSQCKLLTDYLSENGYFCVGDPMRNELCPKSGFKIFEENDDFKNEKLFERQKLVIDNTLENKSASPFFLYLHCSLIHTSYIENVFKVYDDFSEEYFNNKELNSERYDSYLKDALKYSNEIYDYIVQSGASEDTMFIYLSDHGMGIGEKLGERAYGVYTYDYSIRMFAHFIYPAFFESNSECNYLSSNVDLLPTILDFLEIDTNKKSKSLDGISLVPFLNKSSEMKFLDRMLGKKERFIYSETGGLYGPWPSPDEPNVKCIRSDNWKLIHNLTPDTWELYNLKADPEETLNLYDNNLAISRRMQNELENNFNL